MPRALIVAAVVAVGVLLAGCQSGSATETGSGFVSGSGTVDLEAGEREPAPAVTGETLGGDELSVESLEGVVVLNFWASWCGPCAAEAPDLVATHERYADRGVNLVGVNVRDSRTNAQSFERDFDKPYPSLYDEDSSIAASFGGIGASALPTTIILDDDHRVAARLFGRVTETQLATRIERLLDEAAANGDGGESANR